MTPRPLSCLSHQSRQGGYPFHCPRGATPLLLVVNGRRRHNGWGSGTASWCLGAVKWIPPSRQIALKRSRHLPLKVTAKVWQSDRYRSLWDGYSPTPGSWSRAPAGSRPRRMGHAKSPDDNNAARSNGECDVSHITDACHAGSGRTMLRPIGGSAMDFESCLSRARIQGRLESGQRRGRNCDWGRSACSLTAARRFCEWSRPATKKLRRQG